MKLIVSLIAALIVSSAASAATLEEDVVRYVAIFSGDTSQHNHAVESLAWMGISDPRLYDVIEQRLLSEAKQAKTDRHEKDRVARYIRALGFSGQEKYTPTIRKYVSDETYDRYARNALEDMQVYRSWNPVISNRSTFSPEYSDDVNRIMNMLRSNDMLLKRIGAKRIYHAHEDEVLLDVLATELQANYQRTEGGEAVDAVAWMVKALGSAKNPKYRPLFKQVAKGTKDHKIARYARQQL